MRRTTVVGFAVVLVLTLLVGVSLQPDDGTALSRPPGVGLKVDGADHAKPLPRVVTVQDLIPTLRLVVAVLLSALVAGLLWLGRRRPGEVPPALRAALTRADARRGPPAVV